MNYKIYKDRYEVYEDGTIIAMEYSVKLPCGQTRVYHRHVLPNNIYPGKNNNWNKYYQVAIDGKKERVHRIVATCWIPNPNNLPYINHKDGNKLNNCVNNLEWCTPSENAKHAYDNGLINIPIGEHYFSEEEKDYILANYKPFSKEFSYTALGKKFGVNDETMSRAIKRFKKERGL